MGNEEVPGSGSAAGAGEGAAQDLPAEGQLKVPDIVWNQKGGQEIGKFADLGVQAAIDRALEKAPPDALVVIGHADSHGAFAAVAIQKDIGFGKLEWSIEAVKSKDAKIEWKTEIVATVPL